MRQRTRTILGSLAAATVISLTPTANAMADLYWQCVPFARLLSGIQIYGDARTWWGQAGGKYETGRMPRAGAVLTFKPTGKMQLGHVAVVSRLVTDRVIQITHANWSRIGGALCAPCPGSVCADVAHCAHVCILALHESRRARR